MSTSFRWRRKSSTPFFPGAWPNSSTSTQGHASIFDAELGQSQGPGAEQGQGQSQKREQRVSEPDGWPFSTRLEKLPFEDDYGVGGTGSSASADVTITHGYFDGPRSMSPVSPELVHAPLSASLSQESNFTDVSTAASEGVVTPELALPPDRPWIATADYCQHPGHGDGRFFPLDNISKTVVPPKTTSNRAEANSNAQDASRSSSVCLDAPLLKNLPGLPPLSLQSSRLSLSYMTTPLCTRGPDTPPAPPSPQSVSSSIPSSFAIPSPNLETEDAIPPQVPVIIATDFYPVLDAEPNAEMRRTPSSYSYSANTDSPVLPSRGSLLANSTQAFSPSSTDLDAFALAAASAASKSSLSIPTSLHTASVSASAYDTSPCGTTRERSYTVPSAIGSSAVAHGECASPSNDIQECDYGVQCECGFDSHPYQHEEASTRRARRRSVPMPRPSMTRSISSHVDVGDRQSMGRGRPKKLLMGRVRKLGGKFMNLFKAGKGGGDRDGKLGVQTITTTAVTAVEYRSEHPIPRVHRRSHAPPTLTPANSPKADRRRSFHPLDDATNRPLISIPKSRSSMAVKSSRRSTDREGKGKEVQASSTQQRTARTRTQTVPSDSSRNQAVSRSTSDVRNMRRFSLSSALAKQRLDSLRATLIPHPSLSVLSPPLPNRDAAGPASPTSSTAVERMQDARGSRVVELAPAFEQTDSHVATTVSNATQTLMPPSPGIPGLSVTTPPATPVRIQSNRLGMAPPPSPLGQLETPKPTDAQKGRGRARGFSLSSAISKRALHARSMIAAVGRRDKEDETTERSSPAKGTVQSRARGATIATVTDDGVQFDMLTPFALPMLPHLGPATPERRIQSTDDQDAASEHAPTVSDLGSMSFAHEKDVIGSSYSNSSTDLLDDTDSMPGSYLYSHSRSRTFGGDEDSDCRAAGIRVRDQIAVQPTMLHLSPSTSFAHGTSFGIQPDDLNELEVAEREEEQGFMRALGLEFDEIARRVRCE